MAVESKLPSGTKVKILSSSDSRSGNKFIGHVGVIVRNDQSNVPYKVKFEDDNEFWFTTADLELADGTPHVNITLGVRVFIAPTDNSDEDTMKCIGRSGYLEEIDPDDLNLYYSVVLDETPLLAEETLWFAQGEVKTFHNTIFHVTGSAAQLTALRSDFIAAGGEDTQNEFTVDAGDSLQFDFNHESPKPTVRVFNYEDTETQTFEALDIWKNLLVEVPNHRKKEVVPFSLAGYEVELLNSRLTVGCKVVNVSTLEAFEKLQDDLGAAALTSFVIDGNTISRETFNQLMAWIRDQQSTK